MVIGGLWESEEEGGGGYYIIHGQRMERDIVYSWLLVGNWCHCWDVDVWWW